MLGFREVISNHILMPLGKYRLRNYYIHLMLVCHIYQANRAEALETEG